MNWQTKIREFNSFIGIEKNIRGAQIAVDHIIFMGKIKPFGNFENNTKSLFPRICAPYDQPDTALSDTRNNDCTLFITTRTKNIDNILMFK